MPSNTPTRTSRRRDIVPIGFIEKPSMALLRRIPDGNLIELVLVKSTQGATRRVKGTLRSVGLDRHTGARSRVKNHSRSTPGMLHQLRHLVAISPAGAEESVNGSRNGASGAAGSSEELNVTTYVASGGKSSLVSIGHGWTVRIEAHPGSFAVVWPARASLTATMAWLNSRGAAGAQSMIADAGAEPRRLDWPGVLALSESESRSVGFARVELGDVVLTWAKALRQLPAPTAATRTHELGVGAETVDLEFLSSLMSETGTADVKRAVPALMRHLEDILEDRASGDWSVRG